MMNHLFLRYGETTTRGHFNRAETEETSNAGDKAFLAVQPKPSGLA